MQCSVPFVQQSLCLQWWDNGLQWWVYNGCTVRFVYRIFEYSFVLGIFDWLGFRIFVLALINFTNSVYNVHIVICVQSVSVSTKHINEWDPLSFV